MQSSDHEENLFSLCFNNNRKLAAELLQSVGDTQCNPEGIQFCKLSSDLRGLGGGVISFTYGSKLVIFIEEVGTINLGSFQRIGRYFCKDWLIDQKLLQETGQISEINSVSVYLINTGSSVSGGVLLSTVLPRAELEDLPIDNVYVISPKNCLRESVLCQYFRFVRRVTTHYNNSNSDADINKSITVGLNKLIVKNGELLKALREKEKELGNSFLKRFVFEDLADTSKFAGIIPYPRIKQIS